MRRREQASVRPARRVRGEAPARRRAAACRRADESGGAVSLWVVLMVPVSAFAAVVAMAGPQRIAAESSMDEAADDLATMAVAWRDGHDRPDGPLPAFPPECAVRTRQQTAELVDLDSEIGRLDPNNLDLAQVGGLNAELNRLLADFRRAEPALPAQTQDELQTRLDNLRTRLDAWDDACTTMFNWIVADLGNLGVDMNSLRGFYSDSLSLAQELPCTISPKVEVRDAVHVALAADWQYAGWAAAQVWPDGTRVGAESIGRKRRSVSDSNLTEKCEQNLELFDLQGRALVLGNPDPDSRQLSQSVPGRTAIEG